ncbi:MAG: hypothetical protein GY949_21350 [Gammaproteobacteria bacterium]|nr:hypothetical protein [Gammaproteobacteria bacterium]
MGNELDPLIGNWYQHLDKGQMFRVVAFDEDVGQGETPSTEELWEPGKIEELESDSGA